MSIISNIIQDLTLYVKRFTGTAAPSSTPDRAGSLHFDTVAKKTYASYGISSSADWSELSNVTDTSMRDFGICQGRLTLESGVPVSTSDQEEKGTLYFTPYKGNMIDIYDGSNWVRHRFTELSLSLSSLLKNTIYDIFCDYAEDACILSSVAWNSPSGGSITTITDAVPRVANTSTPPVTKTVVTIAGNSVSSSNKSWRVGTVVAGTSFTLLNLDGTNSTDPGSEGTGGTFVRLDDNQTRATAITYQDGILVQGNKRYLGTIKMTDVDGECEDSKLFKGVWNLYNQVYRYMYDKDTGTTTLTGATYYLPSNDYSHSLYFVVGNVEEPVISTIMSKFDPSADGVSGYVYPVLNSKYTIPGAEEMQVSFASGPPARFTCTDFIFPVLGSNYFNALMNASTSSVAMSEIIEKLMIKM